MATAAAPAPAKKDGPIKVRATAMGYYHHQRRREGDVFTVRNRAAMGSWMEECDPRTPEHTTPGVEELRRQHDEIRASKSPSNVLGD